MENQGNPWGMSQGERADWAKDLDGVDDRRPGRAAAAPSTSTGSAAPVASTTRTRRSPRRWPSCCSGPASTSPSSARREMCTGDPARRSGNEYLFQMLAMQNIEMLERHGREEDHHPVPALLQHAEERVPAARRQLRGRPPQPAARVADRDRPARRQRGHARGAGHVPRLAATSAATTTSTSRRARSSARSRASRSSRCRATAPRACAAAPAGRACGWRSPSARRSTTSGPRRRSSTGATRVATACPFCYIMIDDGVKAAGVDEDQVKVADIAMHLLDAIEAGEAPGRPCSTRRWPRRTDGNRGPADLVTDVLDIENVGDQIARCGAAVRRTRRRGRWSAAGCRRPARW